MAISTFTRQFSVDKKMAKGFVKEMSTKTSPTLRPDFNSRLAHPAQNESLRSKLLAALK